MKWPKMVNHCLAPKKFSCECHCLKTWHDKVAQHLMNSLFSLYFNSLIGNT